MPNTEQLNKIAAGKGFIAALDQSGGSTPKALRNYGIGEDQYASEDEMFALIHEMRARIITSPVFTGEHILGAILFEKTMNENIEGTPTPLYLTNELNIVPFLKIDKGLAEQENGVQLMKDIPGLNERLEDAKAKGIFGTKERSVIHEANEAGIAACVAQQFEIGQTVLNHDMVPIIEPEININAPDKAACEGLMKAEILKNLDNVAEGQQVMLKLTLPEAGNFYKELIDHDKVLSVVALSGGYDLTEACRRLSQNDGMIASFSRALTNDLSAQQSDEVFNAALANAIAKIYEASVGEKAQSLAA